MKPHWRSFVRPFAGSRLVPFGVQQIAAVRAEICPYRGLRPFREEDAGFFCGREAFTEKLVAGSRTHFLGCRGGRLRHRQVVGSARRFDPAPAPDEGWRVWEIATLVPTDRPLHSLAAALVPMLEPEMTAVDRLAEINKLAGHLVEGAVALRDVAADVIRSATGNRPAAVVRRPVGGTLHHEWRTTARGGGFSLRFSMLRRKGRLPSSLPCAGISSGRRSPTGPSPTVSRTPRSTWDR